MKYLFRVLVVVNGVKDYTVLTTSDTPEMAQCQAVRYARTNLNLSNHNSVVAKAIGARTSAGLSEEQLRTRFTTKKVRQAKANRIDTRFITTKPMEAPKPLTQSMFEVFTKPEITKVTVNEPKVDCNGYGKRLSTTVNWDAVNGNNMVDTVSHGARKTKKKGGKRKAA